MNERGRLYHLKFLASIKVGLRKDYFDPESETIKRSLFDLNFQPSQVRVAKIYYITIDAPSKKDAESSVKLMCSRLLANPTRDEYSIEVAPIGDDAERDT